MGIFIFSCLLWVAADGETARAATVYLDAAANQAVNAEFTLTVFVDNVTDLYGAAFDLTYDPNYLQVVDVDNSTAGVQPKIVEGALLNSGGGAPTFVRAALEDATPGHLVFGITRSGTVNGVDATVPAVAVLSVSFLPIQATSGDNGTTISFSSQALKDTAYTDITPITWTGITLNILPPLTIVASAGANGAIDPSGNVLVAPFGDQTFLINADPGYYVDNINVDGSDLGHLTSYTFHNVMEDHTISATFAEGIYSLVATIAGAPTGISTSDDATLTIGGENVTVYRYKLDQGSYADNATPVSTPINLTGLSEGVHTVAVIGGDQAGNWQAEAAATTASWTVVIPTPGDVNNDESIDLKDAILALQAAAWLTPAETIYWVADVNNDHRIGIQDAIYILQVIGGVRTP